MRDFEQLVKTRLAGLAARARSLQEQADRIARLYLQTADRYPPECNAPSTPPDIDVMFAEVKTALNTTTSRLKDEQRTYETHLASYNASSQTDARRHFALRLERTNIIDLESKARNIIVIAESYGTAIADVEPAVTIAACLVREGPVAGTSESLVAELHRLVHDYRQTLYTVQ